MGGFLAALPGIASAVGGLFGLFKKPASTVPDFKKIRESAEAGGFNPLTALMSGAGGIASGSSTPPLASFDLLSQGLQGVSDALTGKTAQLDAQERLRTDLMQLQLDQARSGVVQAAPPRAVDRVGVGGAPLGRNNATQTTKTTDKPPEALTELVMGDSGLTMANPDAPPEFETDAWTWAREGSFVPNMHNVWVRNTGGPDSGFRRQPPSPKETFPSLLDPAYREKQRVEREADNRRSRSTKAERDKYELWKQQRGIPSVFR